ncbi:glycerophosphodiester phosphodiesterase [Nocardiopsis trehalosi]|jgi:glycerophosphoryl diester phosphodiesterase|uniref:glycerophosphodiester phosphodiesterase n=1 Tax=Nocardiopsis trehalosi TaxID=109329 RepID=UPI000A0181FF|nr:glycerophosphodiester phosphodiesterase family protein [Nocardiopsis trehalosi]
MLHRLGVAAVLTALALAGPAPVTADTDTPAPDAPGRPRTAPVVDVAHRGGSGYAPENTLAAIDAAHARNASVVELDVQRTEDGELVIMHDTTLARTTDVEQVFPGRAPYDVADFTLAEIRRLDAGSWFDTAYAGEPVPTLQEALDRLDRREVGLLLEVKSPVLYPGIEADISQTMARNPDWTASGARGERPRFAVQSFDWESVERSHRLMPDVPHGLLGVVPEDRIADYAEWADQINPNHTRIDADYVRAVHDAGLEVYTYTVNEPDDMRAAIAKGVDGLISDFPDVARRVIAEETGAAAGQARPWTAAAVLDLARY